MEAAIYDDCHNLIEMFVSADSVTFKSFCRQWKLMMFQHMYSSQTSVVEILLTTSTIYHMAKRTICAKDEFGKYLSIAEGNERRNLLRRIGGLYVMYAVYFKQPTRRYVKVQVSMDTWREMTSFIESLHLDPKMDCVRYAFWRLYQADAFRFTALDYMVGLEGLADYDKIGEDNKETDQSKIVRVKLKHKLNAVPELRDTLEGVTKLEEDYNNVKQVINGPGKTKQKNQALPPTNIFHNIQAAIQNIQNIIDDIPVQTTKDTAERNTETSRNRRQIKRKAAGIIDYDEEQTTDDTDESDSIHETSPQVTKTSPIKKMQESRFSKPMGIVNQNLPDHISKDLINASNSEEDEDEEMDPGNIAEEDNESMESFTKA